MYQLNTEIKLVRAQDLLCFRRQTKNPHLIPIQIVITEQPSDKVSKNYIQEPRIRDLVIYQKRILANLEVFSRIKINKECSINPLEATTLAIKVLLDPLPQQWVAKNLMVSIDRRLATDCSY